MTTTNCMERYSSTKCLNQANYVNFVNTNVKNKFNYCTGIIFLKYLALNGTTYFFFFFFFNFKFLNFLNFYFYFK